MISFDPAELAGLLELLHDCPGRIVAAVVPESAAGEALVARLRDDFPELRLEVADDAATPGQLGARAEALGRDGDSLFVVPVDGRRLDTEAARIDFWRRLNYQRERLASGAVRTCLVLDTENEGALAIVADDLWDWAMVFRFPEATAVKSELEVEIRALRSRWQRALNVNLPKDRVARDFAAPLLVRLAAGARQDSRLLANSLTILAYEATPHFRKWGNEATERALQNVAGKGAKQAAKALALLKSGIEKEKIGQAFFGVLADGAQGPEVAELVEALEKSIFRTLSKDTGLAAQLGSMIERIGGLAIDAAEAVS